MEQPVRTKMAELRMICERDIAIQQQKVDAAVNSFRKSLQLIQDRSVQTADDQVKLGKLKSQLREVEDDFVKALAVKTRKEARQMTLMDSISTIKAKADELSRIVQDLRARKDEYEAIVSEQLEALAASEEWTKQDARRRDEMREAFEWYNRVLGFRIEGGHGVKFAFTNINKECPSEEYFFTIRHANDTYTLLDCNPQLDDIKELVHDLNKTNGLFGFVRQIREKFQKAAALGSLPCYTSMDQDSTIVGISAPVSSVSIDTKSEFPMPLVESNKNSKRASRRRGVKSPMLSPNSASSHRQSPRLKAQK
ncbi:hypothetical protein Ancab_012615 [Ancistrocladus abbreviatus]